MTSDLKPVPARSDARRLEPEEPRFLAEPGESRYQRRSAHLRERAAAAIDIASDEAMTIDLTSD